MSENKLLVGVALLNCALARNNLTVLPPMGWMSWELFRCNLATATDDCSNPSTTRCISEALYHGIADALIATGLASAGYAAVHLDDCWQAENRSSSNDLLWNASRFPSGGLALGDYFHAQGLSFALYTKFTTVQCPGAVTFPPTEGFEINDADSFAEWGVDYLKADACGGFGNINYPRDYAALGAALESTGRPITYSCSWPAYMGDNESAKPFGTFINDGCNLWRNWDDIQCNWDSVSSIIDHWGDYGYALAPWAGTGHWHDPDMLLAGANCISDDEERTQMAIWCIIAAPLIMGNDPRNLSASSKATLMNADAIAVSQDPLGQMGIRLEQTSSSAQQTWFRLLANGDVAVALYNKLGSAPELCPTWEETLGGYFDSVPHGSGGTDCFDGLSVPTAQSTCCAMGAACAGFSIDVSGHGCYKPNEMAGYVMNPAFNGFFKASPMPASVNITVVFADVGLFSPGVEVFDIWEAKSLGVYNSSFTATGVPLHGSAFLRLSPIAY